MPIVNEEKHIFLNIHHLLHIFQQKTCFEDFQGFFNTESFDLRLIFDQGWKATKSQKENLDFKNNLRTFKP